MMTPEEIQEIKERIDTPADEIKEVVLEAKELPAEKIERFIAIKQAAIRKVRTMYRAY